MLPAKRQIGLLILITFSLVYFLTAKGHMEVSDTSFSVRTAKAITENHSFSIEIDNEGEKAYVYETKDGKYYSKYG
ncbi:MAG: hypothetical protein JSW17_01605, partial [Candidatus Omnitrophota bacterium]